MARIDNLTNFLTDVADAIRDKKGTTGEIPASSFDTEIASITTSTTEDLTTELTEQTNLLTQQGTTIDEILESLQDKVAGGEISLQEKTVTPTTSEQEVVADSEYNGLSKVVVNAVTSAIDSDIKATNIKKGVNILGVTGTMEEYVEPTLQSKSATPKTTAQTITPDSSYDGLSRVSISAVTSSIDSNIKATNIKKGISILGVAGSLEEGITPTGTLDITENGTYDVTKYASASVNVAGSGGSTDIEDALVTRTITTYTNDRITSIGNQAFRGSLLTSVNLPNVTKINAYGFDSCTSLTDVYIPKVTTLNNYAFQKCTSLVRMEFQQKITTQGAVWINCSALTTLILRGSTMSGLGNKNCLNGTPIANGTGYIYVPDDLVDTYKANTNWSTYAAQIKPLSELEV